MQMLKSADIKKPETGSEKIHAGEERIDIISHISECYAESINKSLYECAVCALDFYPGYKLFSVAKYKVVLTRFNTKIHAYEFFGINVSDDEKLLFAGEPYGIFRRHFRMLNTYHLISNTKFPKAQLKILFGY